MATLAYRQTEFGLPLSYSKGARYRAIKAALGLDELISTHQRCIVIAWIPSVTPNLEYLVLEKLSIAGEGVGSGNLFLLLRDEKVHVSQATVGRVLRLLDHRKLTARVSNKGRILTAAGRRHLEELRHWEGLRHWVERDLKATKPAVQSEHLESLHALRFLDGHLARLAAERATKTQVAEMRRVLARHREALSTMSLNLGREQGLGFHGLVAKAAGNRFLETAVEMIWSLNATMREFWANGYPVTGQYSYPDHVRVFNAIAERDPAGAERGMHAHYDVFIDSVRKHFTDTKAIRRALGPAPAASPAPLPETALEDD
jgi:DNA-binding FadR family transcriptional regulator